MEVWLPVVGFEGWYEVSNLGRVKRVRGGMGAQAGKILKGGPNSDGYLQVGLHRDGKRHSSKVHCLVCQAFNPNPKSLSEVHHKDDVKTHNWSDNLEWISRPEHRERTVASGLVPKGEAHHYAKLTQVQVDDILSRSIPGTNQWERGNTVELAEEYGVSRAAIQAIASGRSWKHILPPKKPVASVGIIQETGEMAS
jgi:hypothetical protein